MLENHDIILKALRNLNSKGLLEEKGKILINNWSIFHKTKIKLNGIMIAKYDFNYTAEQVEEYFTNNSLEDLLVKDNNIYEGICSQPELDAISLLIAAKQENYTEKTIDFIIRFIEEYKNCGYDLTTQNTLEDIREICKKYNIPTATREGFEDLVMEIAIDITDKIAKELKNKGMTVKLDSPKIKQFSSHVHAGWQPRTLIKNSYTIDNNKLEEE